MGKWRERERERERRVTKIEKEKAWEKGEKGSNRGGKIETLCKRKRAWDMDSERERRKEMEKKKAWGNGERERGVTKMEKEKSRRN